MIHTSPTLVIAGSVRERRLCLQIAEWVAGIGRQAIGGGMEVVDLRDWRLPMDDEPGVPAMGGYAQDHTRAWSAKVAAAGAFVFVTPQYNWGYPAALKNALDHLFGEWAGKPALIVAYGGHGGDKCAEQLRQVLTALHMRPVAESVGLTLPRALIEANAGEIRPDEQFDDQRPRLEAAFRELAASGTASR